MNFQMLTINEFLIYYKYPNIFCCVYLSESGKDIDNHLENLKGEYDKHKWATLSYLLEISKYFCCVYLSESVKDIDNNLENLKGECYCPITCLISHLVNCVTCAQHCQHGGCKSTANLYVAFCSSLTI